ncbi:hypothetical protein [Streptomyces sp. ALI-76-A]|uniref:hypothetical protein n=1 Tax=Streptomyces sp. ALI-76-A TaxID=3025736 RepID=UPI00256ED04C|nr:hypothetical protein [Streptomyces sp. ALI-76-A]MDL5199234.1 hypothetical protein [Streptomyces sp. ALI-76-A]
MNGMHGRRRPAGRGWNMVMSRMRTSSLLGALSAGVLLVCGCGGDSDEEAFSGQKADDIAARAVTATEKASSVHMKGTAQANGSSTVELDIRVDDQGNCTGTISGDGGRAELLRSEGGDVLIKGDRAFWTNSARASGGDVKRGERLAGKLAGKWVAAPADGPDAAFCDKKRFLASMDQDKTERQGLKRGETTEVDGEDALTLEKDQEGSHISMQVATEGEPYILKAATKGSEDSSVTFDDYGEKVTVQQPPRSEIVDASDTQS